MQFALIFTAEQHNTPTTNLTPIDLFMQIQ